MSSIGPIALTAAVVATTAGAAVLALRRRYAVYEVEGDSMRPTFAPNDRLLVRCTPAAIRTGDVVIAVEPGPYAELHAELRAGLHAGLPPKAAPRFWIVKRAAALAGEPVPASVRPAVSDADTVPPGMIVLLGDDPGGVDSRTWGFLAAESVVGVVVTRLSRAHEQPPRARGVEIPD